MLVRISAKYLFVTGVPCSPHPTGLFAPRDVGPSLAPAATGRLIHAPLIKTTARDTRGPGPRPSPT